MPIATGEQALASDVLAAIAVANMDSKIIVNTRNSAAGDGDVGYTGVGFTPRVVICFAGCDNNELSDSFSWGVSDKNIAEYCITMLTTQAGKYSAHLVYLESGGEISYAVVKTYDVDGFTLTWTKTLTPTGIIDLVFLCLG